MLGILTMKFWHCIKERHIIYRVYFLVTVIFQIDIRSTMFTRPFSFILKKEQNEQKWAISEDKGAKTEDK